MKWTRSTHTRSWKHLHVRKVRPHCGSDVVILATLKLNVFWHNVIFILTNLVTCGGWIWSPSPYSSIHNSLDICTCRWVGPLVVDKWCNISTAQVVLRPPHTPVSVHRGGRARVISENRVGVSDSVMSCCSLSDAKKNYTMLIRLSLHRGVWMGINLWV